MTRKLEDAVQKQRNASRKYVLPIYGVLGIPLGGAKVVEVANRNAYVYVRLRNNQSEVIQAYNNKVSPSYNLPVIVERRGNRYSVIDIDSERYENNWNSFSPFLPRHGNTHSFDPDSGGGGDTVFVYPRQFMPALVFPSGSTGGPNVIVSAYTLQNGNGTWKYTGNTGTSNLTPYNPLSASGATIVLVYLDAPSGNPYLLVGSGTFTPSNITGASQLTPYIPTVTNPATQIPLSAVRLVSGTTQISWNNIYDVRQFVHTIPTGTGGGGSPGTGSSIEVWDEGISKGVVSVLNFVGSPVDVSVSGTVARVFVTGSASGGSFTGLSGSVPLLDASGNLTSQPSLKWGLSSGKLYLEFGADVVKEANAGRIGYQLFDAYFNIIGAGTVVGERTVKVYDNLFVSSLNQAGSFQIPTIVNSLLATNETGTFVSGEAQLNSGTYGRKDAAWVPVIPENGWLFVQETWTRTGNHTFTVSGDLTSKYRKGTKVKYNDPDLEYGVIGSSSHAGGTTTVNLIPNTSFLMAAAVITGRFICYIENPEGFPASFAYDANPTGFSVQPSSPIYRWSTIGSFITILYNEPNNGTSNATTFTASLPIASIYAVTGVAGTLVDNNSILTTPGRFTVSATASSVTFRTNMAVGAWTASNGKRAVASFQYEY